MTKVDENASFARFVYPFLFDAQTFDDRMEVTRSAHWEGRNRQFEVWRQESFPEFDLLPHAARYLNPPPDTSPTARLWELGHDALHSPAGLGAQSDWKLILPKGVEIPFCFGTVHLTLFRVGVGFLTVHAKPETAEVADWLNFLHYFRFAWGARNVAVRAERRTGRDQVDPYFPELAGGVDQHPDGVGVFGAIVEALLYTAVPLKERPEAPDDGDWLQEVFKPVFVPHQLLPFAAVYVDGVSEGGDPERETVELLYRMRSFFHSGQKIHPTPEDSQLYDHPALLPYAEGMWFVFSLDGGAFVACDAPRDDFWRGTLPDHLNHVYFLLFLLVLHQRYALTMLEERVARHWVVGEERQAEEERIAAFERIHDTLLSFTARGYFSQVMQQEHHHRVYQRWQETLQVQRLYGEVRGEVQEMYQYVLLRQTERLQQAQEQEQRRTWQLEWRLNLIVALVGLPLLALTFLIAIGPTFEWWIVGGVLVVSLVLGMLVLLVIRR
jgi:hypothetical protein